MISSPGCVCLAEGRRSRRELDDRLDDLASGDAQVVPLEIDARAPTCCACAMWRG